MVGTEWTVPIRLDLEVFVGREEMLRRVRDALKALPDDERTVTIGRHRRAATELDPAERAELVEMFAERIKNDGAQVVRVSEETIPDAVTEALTTHDVGSVAVPEGLRSEWLSAWAESDGHRIVSDHLLAAAETPDAVVTGCAGAVVEPATVVLDGGPGQGRASMLAPGCHICVVRAAQIEPALPDVLDKLDSRRPITWFRGPAAAPDDELVPVPAGQGPRHLVVVIVE
ncbi:LutC/YkgG family protein [Nocardia pseudobrasiliensis]|uniref:L-lactate dehydrogenase complex protein LldG n=1 Tax=Nocardia pseudobrasiliensis TaxID=45979 RepID=A0A370I5E5_9NOCA|nr:LUD domain-containing protein [Nocardia pseudobrasiliensis]RDI65957.1 L-lactate dehydrogenase complex protein LldG [Nocardia pseudobrasiliensis]